MISQKQVIALAGRYRLRTELIDRDYAMNFILDALHRCPSTKGKVFFKGGCCIHKCFSGLADYSRKSEDAYFNERFSTDIDLTVSPDLMSSEALEKAFGEVKDYVRETHGLVIDQFSFPIHKNEKQNKENCRGYLHFQGAMFNPKYNSPKMKLDITSDETIPTPSEPVRIYDPYEKKELYAQCYTQEDLIAEKLRALMDRTAARDLYDLSSLILKSQNKDRINMICLGRAIEEKFALKKMDTNFNIDVFITRREEFAESWKKSLKDQIGSLPDFSLFWDEENIKMILSFAQTCISAYHMDQKNNEAGQRTRWDRIPSVSSGR